jgi:hypothetical protein
LVTSPEKQANRDSKTGRFKPGASGNPNGRPTKRSLTDALRDITDPDQLAKKLLKRAETSDQVLIYVYDRLEGRPKQSTEVEHSGKLDVALSWDDGEQA